MFTLEKPTIDLTEYDRDISGKYLLKDDIQKAIFLVQLKGITLEIIEDQDKNEMFRVGVFSPDYSSKTMVTAYDYKTLKTQVNKLEAAY